MKKTKSKRRPLRRAKKTTSTVSLATKQYVNKVLHTAIENKSVQINGGYSFAGVASDPDLNAYPMCPLSTFWSIGQGVGAGSRVGNDIKVRKVMLNYVLRPLPYDVITNPFPQPQEILLILGYVKNTPSFAPIAGDINGLFQSGNTTTGPIGSLRDIIAVPNTDYWVIKKKWSHKLGYANYGGTGTLPAQQSFSNNDFKLNIVKRLDITKFIPKTVNFNDTNVTVNTKNLFFMQEAVPCNGSSFAAGQLTANIEFWIDFHYEDA